MKEIRKGPQNFIHLVTECFWCKNELIQRKDVFKRQFIQYGHQCCRSCFGKEPTFKAARKRVMLENNPWKGNKLNAERRAHLSKIKMGGKAWNKGLTVKTHPSVAKYVKAAKDSGVHKGKIGPKNPNWKGGISYYGYNHHPKEWALFRKHIIGRDGAKCYKCSSRFLIKELEVHHLCSRTTYPEQEFDDQNCVVLCKKCHKIFHSKFGIKKFTPNNFKNFLNEDRRPEEYFKWD